METDSIMKILESQKKIKDQKPLDPNQVLVPPEFSYLVDQEKTYQDTGFDQTLVRARLSVVSPELRSTDSLNQILAKGSISSDKLGPISTMNITEALEQLTELAPSAAVSTSLNAGSRGTLTSTLTDRKNPTRIMLAVFHVTAYQGSIAAGNEIPFGSGVTGSDWDTYYAHDWGSNDNKKSSGIHYVRNLSAGTLTVVWDLHWRYLGSTAS